MEQVSETAAHAFPRRLRDHGERPALIVPGRSIDFTGLVAQIDAWRVRLRTSGLEPGDAVALRGEHMPETCALLIALGLDGYIAVPLPAGERAARSEQLRIARVRALYHFRRDGSWTRDDHRPDLPPHPLVERLREEGSGGIVLFSSGSTGKSKAGLLSFAKLVTRYLDPRPAWRTLVFLTPDHIGGINTILHVLANGGTVIGAVRRDAESVCAAIAEHRVELLPTTPTFLRLLLISEAYRRHDLSSLRMITYGTEPMPETTLGALNETFPDIRFKQTYGLSELGILPTRSESSDSLWIEVGGLGYETRVVDGILHVRSPTAMVGYLNADAPFDADGWFITGDAVEVRGNYLRILGRHTEMINVGGEKVYPAEVEAALLDLDGVREATVWGKANPITGQIVAARIALAEPEPLGELRRRVRRFCRARLAPYKVPAHIETVAEPLHNERYKKVRPHREPVLSGEPS